MSRREGKVIVHRNTPGIFNLFGAKKEFEIDEAVIKSIRDTELLKTYQKRYLANIALQHYQVQGQIIHNEKIKVIGVFVIVVTFIMAALLIAKSRPGAYLLEEDDKFLAIGLDVLFSLLGAHMLKMIITNFTEYLNPLSISKTMRDGNSVVTRIEEVGDGYPSQQLTPN